MTRVEGVALVVPGDDVDTDVMYPGAYLNVEDPAQMAQYLFEGFDPSLRERVVEGTILVVGSNFGIGSSREHVPLAMQGSGIRGVVGRSFARIFYRNCINLGLLALEQPELSDSAQDDELISIDLERGTATLDGVVTPLRGLHPFVVEAVAAGGFVEWSRSHPPH